jgi:hypothetical protein
MADPGNPNFGNIPEEMLGSIMKYLSPNQRHDALTTSKATSEIWDKPVLWRARAIELRLESEWEEFWQNKYDPAPNFPDIYPFCLRCAKEWDQFGIFAHGSILILARFRYRIPENMANRGQVAADLEALINRAVRAVVHEPLPAAVLLADSWRRP